MADEHPRAMPKEGTIFTVGHSTHTAPEFLRLLQSHGISMLVDIRAVPRSRHNPHFTKDTLELTLKEAHIGYRHMQALGGLRRARHDSPNAGWRNAAFRGYADYMQSDAFSEAVDELAALGKSQCTAVMCAEAVPWRCHRSLVADALTVRGVPVEHIMNSHSTRQHLLSSFAHVEGMKITYPERKAEETNKQGALI